MAFTGRTRDEIRDELFDAVGCALHHRGKAPADLAGEPRLHPRVRPPGAVGGLEKQAEQTAQHPPGPGHHGSPEARVRLRHRAPPSAPAPRRRSPSRDHQRHHHDPRGDADGLPDGTVYNVTSTSVVLFGRNPHGTISVRAVARGSTGTRRCRCSDVRFRALGLNTTGIVATVRPMAATRSPTRPRRADHRRGCASVPPGNRADWKAWVVSEYTGAIHRGRPHVYPLLEPPRATRGPARPTRWAPSPWSRSAPCRATAPRTRASCRTTT